MDLTNAILREINAHGLGLFFLTLGGLLLILIPGWLNRRKSVKPTVETPSAVAQSLAEPDPDKEPKGKPYTYEDYIRDIRDNNIQLEEILKRCGGVIPEKPKGTPEVKYTDRMNERMRWFGKMAKENPGLKMTKPPVPIPVLLMKGQVVRCKCCCHGHGGIYTTGFIDQQPVQDSRYCPNCHGQCHSCGGKGYVIIT